MRQVRQPDHFGTRNHVQGVRLVHHGLFRQDETANGRHVKTNTDRHNDGTLRVFGIGRSSSDNIRTVAGSRIRYTIIVSRDFQLLWPFNRQRTRIRHKLKFEVISFAVLGPLGRRLLFHKCIRRGL